MKKFFLSIIVLSIVPVIVQAASIFSSSDLSISEVSASPVTTSSAMITWETSFNGGECQVEYGLTTDYGSLTSLNSDNRQTISGLEFYNTYHYRIIYYYNGYNTTSDDYSFNLSDFPWPNISSATPQTLTSLDDVVTITGEGFYSGDGRYLVCGDLRNGSGINVTNWTDTSVQFAFDENDWHYSSYAQNSYECKIQVAVGGNSDYYSNEVTVYIDLPEICTSWTYSEWEACSEDGQQARSILTSSPEGCIDGEPETTQSCTYTSAESEEEDSSNESSNSAEEEASGSFTLLVPEGRDEGVLHNDLVKIEYYGSDMIDSVYLDSTEVELGIEEYSIFMYGPPLIIYEVVTFYPPSSFEGGDVTVYMSDGTAKNLGYLDVYEIDVSADEYSDYEEEETTTNEEEINDTDGDGVPDEVDYYPTQESSTITKEYSFQYNMLGDNNDEWVTFTIEVPEDLYLFYLNENHVFTDDFDNISSFVTSDDIVIQDIVEQIDMLYEEQGLNPIALIYQLAGQIVYSDDRFSISGWDEYPKYPIETLVDGNGDCEDTSFLLAALYKAYDVEPVLVRFESHLGIATIIDQNILDLLIYKYGEDFMYDINDELTDFKLAYLESTGNNSWEFGYMPEELQGQSYTIHVIDEYERESSTEQEEEEENNDEILIFSDVDSYVYKTAIEYVEAQGIVEGYSDGTYKPENPINRAEFTKILIEAYFPDEIADYEGSACLSDVVADEWYSKYVCFAKEKGIIEGYPDGTFQPAQYINIVEALKITLETYFDNINDVGGEWYQKYWGFARSRQYLVDEWLDPASYVTRGEMAELIYRIENE